MASDRGRGPRLRDLAATYDLYPELKRLPDIASKAAWDIANLVAVRPLELRKGTMLGSTLSNHTKPYNLEVCLAYMRGQLVKKCAHCVKMVGPHAECVVLPGFFKGSCTSCQYNDNGARCEHRGISL